MIFYSRVDGVGEGGGPKPCSPFRQPCNTTFSLVCKYPMLIFPSLAHISEYYKGVLASKGVRSQNMDKLK